MTHSVRFEKLVNESRARIKETTPEEVKKKIEKGEKFFLVDIREEHEWQEGHITGATYIGKGIIERDVEKFIPDLNAEVILYCGGGYRSVLAAENLQKMGFTNVVSMDGGWRRWNELGYPTQQ